ncbi:ATP-binding protein [Streptomyces sp. NPDC057298]|uniref:ATP-binding protein n=1 Tax=Streptomyces sp. NPDC057298 TaxID=3346091 RepID=UPI00363DD059
MEAVPESEGENNNAAAQGARPMEDTVALDGEGPVIAQARHHAVGFLTRVQAEYGLPVSARAKDLTQLVVSELVTNARKHAPGPMHMELRIAGDVVEVVVRDSDPVLPVARNADAGRVGQHGLEIVTAVTESLEIRREPAGKRITARIALKE